MAVKRRPRRLPSWSSVTRRKNVEMGYWAGGVFHPIRASDDYDPEDVGERYQYKPAKKKKKKKNSAKSRRLMRSGAKKLAAWVKSQTKTNRGRRKNPVRTEAAVTGKGTGWLKASAVRVRKEGGRYKVEIKR